MKHFFLLVSFLFFSVLAYSQLDKGTWLVGGSGRLNSYKNKYTATSTGIITESKITDISISANIGLFIIDKLAIGLKPSFAYYKYKEYLNGQWETVGGGNTKFLIGPVARYYYLKPDNNYNIFNEVNYVLGSNTRPLPPNDKGSYAELNFISGIEFFFNQSVGVEVSLGYRSSAEKIKAPTGYIDNRKGFFVGVGFQIHLEKD